MRRIGLVVAFLVSSVGGVLSGAVAAAEMAERSVKLAGLSVTVWFDDAKSQAGKPVVVFSHGFHGCSTQSKFLTEALAADGYLVFAPNHRDAACNGGASRRRDPADAPFRDGAAWDEQKYRDRAEDIRNLIATAQADERFAKADWSRLGLAGTRSAATLCSASPARGRAGSSRASTRCSRSRPTSSRSPPTTRSPGSRRR
jgi:hypothetical protein